VFIAVECPHCGKQLRVKEELAGRKGKCPQCQQTFQVTEAKTVPIAAGAASGKVGEAPAPKSAAATGNGHAPAMKQATPAASKAPAPATPEQVREAVLAAFSGKLTPPKVGIVRKFGALIVFAILAVMPIFYLAVIGAVAFGIYWLATSGVLAGQHPAVLWAAEAGLGLVLICLIKPLIEPQRRGVELYPVDKDKEPLVHEFVAKICEQVEAPPPKSIQFECSTRLAAENRRGVQLVLGLPVLGSLSAEQLASAIAGQMALHRPKAGCKMMNWIRGINYWLWRSVYGKSRLDRWLSLVAQRRHFHLAKLLLPLMLMKLPTQAVLFIPMFIANTIGSAVVRRAEFDADRASVRLVGKKTFTGLLERLELIDFSWDGVLADLAFLNTEQQLPDSLPEQVTIRMQDMTPELCAVLRETVNKPDEKPFDSRPSNPDRLEAIAGETGEGVFRCGLAARRLIQDYDGLSRQMTADFYRGRFGGKAG